MFSGSVARQYGTALLVTAVVAIGLAAGPSGADITAESAQAEGLAATGTYTPEDGEALLRVLEAPGASASENAKFGGAPSIEQLGDATFGNGPQSLNGFGLVPESKHYEAWDMKGGSIVPEPATALLMGAGLAALAVYRSLRGRTDTE